MTRDFSPKKLPQQVRSQATFDAIVEACAQLLVSHGYGATTTNHIAKVAGVSIGSLYEYFEDKESVVYEVVRRTTLGFTEDAARPLPDLTGARLEDGVRAWLDVLLAAMRARQHLLRAIAAEVPLALQEPHFREARERHLALARMACRLAGDQVRGDIEVVSFLMVTLVDATFTRLVLDQPEGISEAAVMSELHERIVEWAAPPRRGRRHGRPRALAHSDER